MVEETPVDGTVYDVAHTSKGAYAIGDGGIVLRRDEAGRTKVLDGGPTGNGNTLFGAAVAGYGAHLSARPGPSVNTTSRPAT